MSGAVDMRSLGPGAQAARIAFWFVAAVAVLAALAWAASNIRRIPADSRAVVMRFGAFERTQEAGLALAWPRPFETVLLVPGGARVLEQPIASLERDPRARAADAAAAANASDMPALSDALAGSGYVLTGDNGVVHLSATLYYRVVDPIAYVLQAPHLKPAIERAVSAAVVEVAAARDLDAILVARPELLASDTRMAAQRERLRGDIGEAVQRHFDALAAAHAGLGIEVARVDVQASFPAVAVGAFDSVLSASQTAERAIAEARTAAETTRQSAQQSADQILRSAKASGAERIATAQADATTILQLEAALDAHSDPGLLERAYRERVQQILSKAGRVTTIDPHDASALVLPGKIR